ncbi:MAG: nuclear transport factor 2 family protein [Pseudomonadota bacterium]
MHYLVMVFMLCFSAVSFANDHVVADSKKAVTEFLYGASINDPAAHDKFWADELTYTSSSGNRFGKDHLMSNLSDAEPKKPENIRVWYSAEDIEIKTFGEAVIFNFKLVAEKKDKVTEYYYNTGVLIERDGRFQAVNWNATQIPN